VVEAVKVQFIDEISNADRDRIRATCLYVATLLGDYDQDFVVVGGLVPSLLILAPPAGVGLHVGTQDLDLALSLAILDEERYKGISSRLRGAGFAPDKNEKGKLTRQRWHLKGHPVTIDFLMPPSTSSSKSGKPQHLEHDFAATIFRGLQLAFIDFQVIEIEGLTIRGEHVKRSVRVCGPGAFIVLKALALRSRGERKDAYDLVYVIRNYGSGITDIAKIIVPLVKDKDPDTLQALSILRDEFATIDSIGPIRAMEFELGDGQRDDELQQDIVGAIKSFLFACGFILEPV
jgi:hypothetical protein